MKEFDSDFFSGIYCNNKYVDLGLSVHWATYNVGANRPEEFGEYYPWGIRTSFRLLKMQSYDPRIVESLLSERPSSTMKDISGTEYDIASLYYDEGSAWRTPRLKEFKELVSNTTQEVYELNGTDGLLFTSKINGNSIFLPKAGHWNRFAQTEAEEGGNYWTSDQHVDEVLQQIYHTFFARSFGWYENDEGSPVIAIPDWSNAMLAFPIRPVFDSQILRNR